MGSTEDGNDYQTNEVYTKRGTGEDTKDFDVSDAMSHRSYKSLTTILFPKVTFSDK